METARSRFQGLVLAAAVAAAAAVSACGGVASPSTNQKDTFSGTLLPAGQNFHPFSVSKPGEFEFKITTMSPVDVVGLALGLLDANSTSCLATGTVDAFSTLNKTLTGSIQKGSYCALIFDANSSVRAPVSYTLTVTHP